MAHVNFLAERKFKVNIKDLKGSLNVTNLKRIRLNRLLMVIIAGSALVFMIAFGFIQKMRLDSFLNKTKEVETKVDELKKQLQAGASITIGAKNKEMAISSFERRTSWARVLNNFINYIPKKVWIKSISGGTKNNKMVSINGWAPDQSLVASLTGLLEKMESFSDVKLMSSVVQDKAKSDVNFILQCKLK